MNFSYCPSCGKQGSVKKIDDTNYECGSCRWHFWNNAKGTVAVAFVKNGQVLVSERGIEPHKGMYDLPGGFVDYGETAEAAAIREVQEELGITLTPQQLQLVGVYNNIYDTSGNSTIDVTYLVTDWDGEFSISSDVAKLIWKPFTFIDDTRFSPPYTGLSQVLAARSNR